jgi:hypothetical protein
MLDKLDLQINDADIFIYGKMGPLETKQILRAKHKSLDSEMLLRLQESGEKLWLIRESRVEGLLTVQSESYNVSQSKWIPNTPTRYMLSNDHGWIINNQDPLSDEFNAIALSAGGIIKLTEENTTPHLPGLLNLLAENGYTSVNRLNPKQGQETQTRGYSTYVSDSSLLRSEPGHFFKIAPSAISLPEGILQPLSCVFTTEHTGKAKLMKDPVTLVTNGISYERATLLQKYPGLEEGKDFYPNIKLRTIINYVAATSLKPAEYLAKLHKVEEDILDPILGIEFVDPVLSPSGHSYERSSIEQWISSKLSSPFSWGNVNPIPDPITKKNINGKTMPENINLRSFIKAWPRFFAEQQEKLQSQLDAPSF